MRGSRPRESDRWPRRRTRAALAVADAAPAVGLVTSGRDLAQLRRLLRGRSAYTAADVVTFALRYLSTRSERHPITTRLGATTLPTGDHRANRYALAWLLNEAPSTRASA